MLALSLRARGRSILVVLLFTTHVFAGQALAEPTANDESAHELELTSNGRSRGMSIIELASALRHNNVRYCVAVARIVGLQPGESDETDRLLLETDVAAAV